MVDMEQASVGRSHHLHSSTVLTNLSPVQSPTFIQSGKMDTHFFCNTVISLVFIANSPFPTSTSTHLHRPHHTRTCSSSFFSTSEVLVHRPENSIFFTSLIASGFFKMAKQSQRMILAVLAALLLVCMSMTAQVNAARPAPAPIVIDEPSPAPFLAPEGAPEGAPVGALMVRRGTGYSSVGLGPSSSESPAYAPVAPGPMSGL
ncbi:hypothetical protein M758_1G168300 [Ceratodon purpureus]|nr:hypothetical protein M758_1G168300 [Ceratodon purpureus]